MARVGVSITKSVSFRGVQQEFSNVYHYNGGTWDETAAESLIDQVKAAEVPLHASDVTFVRGACWSADGSPGSNEMIKQKLLSGVGSFLAIAAMDRERAFLVQFRAGNDSRGHPVFLRKWYHSCGAPTGVTVGSAQMQQTAALSGASRDAVEGLANVLFSVTVASVPRDLCAASGRLAAVAGVCHEWLEHHQLGDMWR